MIVEFVDLHIHEVYITVISNMWGRFFNYLPPHRRAGEGRYGNAPIRLFLRHV